MILKNENQQLKEIRDIMKLQFVVMTCIIVSAATAFGFDSSNWILATKIAVTLITGMILAAPLTYGRAKHYTQLLTNENKEK